MRLFSLWVIVPCGLSLCKKTSNIFCVYNEGEPEDPCCLNHSTQPNYEHFGAHQFYSKLSEILEIRLTSTSRFSFSRKYFLLSSPICSLWPSFRKSLSLNVGSSLAWRGGKYGGVKKKQIRWFSGFNIILQFIKCFLWLWGWWKVTGP